MFKKSLLLTLLCFALFGVGRAQVTIGDLSTAGNDSYLPMNSLYEYSYSQQIYTADEIGMAGTINSITVWLYGNANLYEMPFNIYMVETDKENFESTNDWISMTSSDIVYTGSVTVHNTDAEAYTFNLETPFSYSGSGNLVIAFDNNTGLWKRGLNGKVFTANDGVMRAIYAHRDSNDYDPTNMTGITANSIVVTRNVIEMDITPSGSGPTCAKPNGLAVETSVTNATFTWNSEATAFDVAHSMDASADPNNCIVGQATTNSYQFTNLELGRHYVWVRANCGSDGYSDWSSKKSFHIGYCVPAPSSVDNDGISNVTFGTGDYIVNNDTPKATYADYSDLVGAVQTGVEASIAITFKTGYTYNTYVWVDLDNSFSFEADEVICYGESTNANPTTLTLNFIIPATQTLGDFRMRIGSADSGLGSDPTAAGPCYTGTYACFQDYTLRVLEAPSCLTPTGLTVSNVTAHSATLSWTGTSENYTVQYRTSIIVKVDNWESITTVDTTVTLTNLIPETEYEYRIQANCGVNGDSEWAYGSFTTTVACPAPTAAVSNITISTADVSCTNTTAENFNVKLFTIANDSIVFENVTMPYTLTDLEENTTYTVKVQAICGGDDGESEWSNGKTFTTAETCPDGMVCIGTGDATSSNLPAYNYFNYSYTQQIYTADEIGMSGQISSIEFKNTGAEKTMTCDVYLMATNKTAFESTSDWVAMNEADLVFSGEVTFAVGEWTTIELDNPFEYDGTTNLLVSVANVTGTCTYSPHIACLTFPATDQALYAFRDNPGAYDITAPGVNGTLPAFKNRIRMAIGEPPACPKPHKLTVNYTGGTTAVVSWTSDATAWNLQYFNEYDEFEIEVTENPYTLTNLDLATRYSVMVQAICGEDASEWTRPVSFFTDLCLPEDQCEITIELSDSYGDGWNGSELAVVDVSTEAVLGTYTIADATSSSETFTLAVCDGRNIQFVYTGGNYPTENGWVITDVNGDVIAEHEGCNDGCAVDDGVIADYTVNCEVPGPEIIVWDEPGDWPGGEVPPAGGDIIIPDNSLVIIPEDYTANVGEITIGAGSSIVIEEGGQLYHTEEVEVTMQLDVPDGYAKNSTGWRLFACPVTSTSLGSGRPVEGTHLNTGTFDLYKFDEGAADGLEWINYKQKNPVDPTSWIVNPNFTNLDLTKGYLYANTNQNVDIVMSGYTVPTVSTYAVPMWLSKTPGAEFEGVNLVGNPYTCKAYVSNDNGDMPYYVMNYEGTGFNTMAVSAGTPIYPMKAVLVMASEDDEMCNFKTVATPSSKGSLNITVNQGRGMVDNAILSFGSDNTLEKFQFNPNHTKVYMPVDGKDYAVASAEDEGEMPVCFKAEENGSYTLSFNSEDTEFRYLHLIDNMTGNDVDLLESPSYSFMAKTTDYASRFKLVFAKGNNDSDSNFGFISNGEIVINGEGILQIIDALGRSVFTKELSTFHSSLSTFNFTPGVYMLRLINGEKVKTQKIVVK